MINKISFIVFCFILITSCGSDDSFEEIIIGTWSGNLTQVDCCTYDVEITISSLTLDQNIATGRYSNSNAEICNNDIFFCDDIRDNPITCSFTWRLDVLSESSITVFEEASGDCANGNVTLNLLDDNTLQYLWVDLFDPDNRATGILTNS